MKRILLRRSTAGQERGSQSAVSAAGKAGPQALHGFDMEALLSVSNLTATYPYRDRRFRVLSDISFDVAPGRIVGIVGESGSGKSTLALVLMGLADEVGASVEQGEVILLGEDLLLASPARKRELRRSRLGLVVQDPHSSLNPALTVGSQVAESIWSTAHNRRERYVRGLEVLRQVGLPRAEDLWRSHPHKLSGGMKQRVVAAIATAEPPRLLIADEPTTALDVTTQAQYLRLLLDLRERLNLSIILISHDLGVIAEVCDDVMVMYAGRIVEAAPVERLFDAPAHPYTQGLLVSRRDTRNAVRDRQTVQIPGRPPRLWDLPNGCSFEPRCPVATAQCSISPGDMTRIGHRHYVECRVASAGRG